MPRRSIRTDAGEPAPQVKGRKDQVEPKAQIFLSYAHEDRLRVEDLQRDLVEAGFSPWRDTTDILPGEKWADSIENAIRQADFILACLSAHSINKRGGVQREMRIALDKMKE